jgi:hypothetical protein
MVIACRDSVINWTKRSRLTRAAELRAITKLEEGRYGPGFMFSMTLCACALAGFVLVYIVFR